MLIRFSVENVLSFRERVELSFVASEDEQKHPEHLSSATTPDGRPLLKLAVLYGANASGKSNLVNALAMAQRIIVDHADVGARLPIRPFKLDAESRNKPSRFEFEIRLEETCYAYGFVASAEKVVEEWLYEIGAAEDVCIFERKDAFRFPGVPCATDEERQFLAFTGKGTLENRLFLAECRERDVVKNVPGARGLWEVMEWWRTGFVLFPPNGIFIPLTTLLVHDELYRSRFECALRSIDTGIAAIVDDPVEYPVSFSYEERRLFDGLGRGAETQITRPDGRRFRIRRDAEGQLKVSQLMFRHGHTESAPLFAPAEESDGTRRLLDLVQAWLELLESARLIVIDEFDRSLHPEVSHSLLANFISTSQGRSQLLVTTHETTLLDQDFLRRDEIWLVDKGTDQSSRLTSLVEYNTPPEGTDLRQDYLHGRFGGVPVIRDFHWLDKHASGT